MALQALALGLPAYILVKILQPLFFAHRNTKTPMQIAMIMMGVNIILAFVLMQFLAHAGLALATALAGWVQVLLLLIALSRRKIAALSTGILAFGLRAVLAGLIMAACLYGAIVWMPDMPALLELLLMLGIGGGSYLVAATVLTGYKWRHMFHRQG